MRAGHDLVLAPGKLRIAGIGKLLRRPVHPSTESLGYAARAAGPHVGIVAHGLGRSALAYRVINRCILAARTSDAEHRQPGHQHHTSHLIASFRRSLLVGTRSIWSVRKVRTRTDVRT